MRVPFLNHGTCIIYTKWDTIFKMYIVQVKIIINCCKHAPICSTMFPLCQADILKVISNNFGSAKIIYTNTNTSVPTAICATTISIILTLLNDKAMTMCAKILIYNCSSFGYCQTIWWNNLTVWKYTFKERLKMISLAIGKLCCTTKLETITSALATLFSKEISWLFENEWVVCLFHNLTLVLWALIEQCTLTSPKRFTTR